MMKDQWDIDVCPHSVSVYYQRYVAGTLLEQREKSLGVADALNAAIVKNPGKFQRSIFDMVAVKYSICCETNKRIRTS